MAKPLERRRKLAAGDGVDPTSDRKLPKREMERYASPLAVRGAVPPAPVGLQERGEVEWHKIWTAGHWLHGAEDYHLVEMIAKAYDEITQYEEEIARVGLIVRGYNGQQTANPLIKEMRSAQQLILTCLSKLGFSPTDRARLGLAEAKARSALSDLQSKTQAKRGE